MLKQTLVLGLLTLSGLYSAHAQEVLTLEKALNTAFEHSPSLIQSKLSLEQRQLNLKAQDASLKSQFSLDVTPFRYTRNNQYDNFNSKWYANETKVCLSILSAFIGLFVYYSSVAVNLTASAMT
jgi:outer membrane protein